MNKKGFLLAEETLKIIISMIVIVFLVYFLVSLYFSIQNNKNLEFAQASLENLIEEINVGAKDVEFYNPLGWVLISWPYEDTISPEICSNFGWDECICICKRPGVKWVPIPKSWWYWGHKQIKILVSGKDFQKACNKNGFCLERNPKINVKGNNDNGGYIYIYHPPVESNIQYSENEVTIIEK